MIPVMLFGVLFARKRYSLREYMCVGLITAGIVVFNLSGPHKQVCADVYAPLACVVLEPPWRLNLSGITLLKTQTHQDV